MDPALSLSLRHALHAVNSGLVFQHAIDPVSDDLHDDFLESAGSALRLAVDFHLPAATLEILAVHSEEVSREYCRLVTAGTSSDFKNRVLAVLRVGRDEQELDFLFHLRKFRLNLRNLLFRHLP